MGAMGNFWRQGPEILRMMASMGRAWAARRVSCGYLPGARLLHIIIAIPAYLRIPTKHTSLLFPSTLLSASHTNHTPIQVESQPW